MNAAAGHAVVLGASMAGLMAARALTERYPRVTVIERDDLPISVVQRRGIPQGHHLHGFHPRGLDILEELFPGITGQLADDGAVEMDMLANFRWHLSSHQFAKDPIGLRGLFASRPFVESHVRDRVRALPQITMMERCDVVAVVTDDDQRQVTGVRVHRRGDADPTTISAALVIDATGRGSRLPRWLEELGYERPGEDRVEIGVGYATRVYRLRPDALAGDKVILTAATPANPRLGVMAAIEGNRHIVSLSGILGDHPPTDAHGFRQFAASLNFPDIAEALEGAEPLDEGATFRYPTSVRRRYERLSRFPAGLLAIGDAVCSFNPSYGQGMTVAGTQALALRDAVIADPVPEPRRYFRRIARTIDPPWNIAVGADLANPRVAGRRTPQVRLVNAYLPRLHAAAAHDSSLAEAFVRVMGLLDRPEGLLRPDRVLRVWQVNRRQLRSAAGAAERGKTPSARPTTVLTIPAPSRVGTPAFPTDLRPVTPLRTRLWRVPQRQSRRHISAAIPPDGAAALTPERPAVAEA